MNAPINIVQALVTGETPSGKTKPESASSNTMFASALNAENTAQQNAQQESASPEKTVTLPVEGTPAQTPVLPEMAKLTLNTEPSVGSQKTGGFTTNALLSSTTLQQGQVTSPANGSGGQASTIPSSGNAASNAPLVTPANSGETPQTPAQTNIANVGAPTTTPNSAPSANVNTPPTSTLPEQAQGKLPEHAATVVAEARMGGRRLGQTETNPNASLTTGTASDDGQTSPQNNTSNNAPAASTSTTPSQQGAATPDPVTGQTPDPATTSQAPASQSAVTSTPTSAPADNDPATPSASVGENAAITSSPTTEDGENHATSQSQQANNVTDKIPGVPEHVAKETVLKALPEQAAHDAVRVPLAATGQTPTPQSPEQQAALASQANAATQPTQSPSNTQSGTTTVPPTTPAATQAQGQAQAQTLPAELPEVAQATKSDAEPKFGLTTPGARAHASASPNAATNPSTQATQNASTNNTQGAAQAGANATPQAQAPSFSEAIIKPEIFVESAPKPEPLPAMDALTQQVNAERPQTPLPQSTLAARIVAHQAPVIPPSDLALHIAKRVQEGTSHFEIRLDPAELGRIEVKMEFGHDGRAQAVLSAERQDTLDLLQRDSRHLERALQAMGLNVDSDSLNFSLKDHGAGQESDGEWQQNASVDPEPQEETNLTLEVGPPPIIDTYGFKVTGQTGVNISA